jgi:hypothetical protein
VTRPEPAAGNDAKVLLDLNFPGFLKELLDLDVNELYKVQKALKKLLGMTWQQVFEDKGLRWEEPVTTPGKYSIRLSRSYRAVVVRDKSHMRFQSLHLDHDGAYGKK